MALFRPTRLSLTGRLRQFIILACAIAIVGWIYLQFGDRASGTAYKWLPGVPEIPLTQRAHPIDKLIKDSRGELAAMLAKETVNVERGAHEYRKRRGRHPPPGFAEWYKFARSHQAVIVEDFFDQIYTDLTPYWGINASVLRQQARTFEHRITVRKGNATWTSDDPERIWMKLWHSMISTIMTSLPDLDIPINIMDESRIIVPFETLSELVAAEQRSRRIVPEEQAISSWENMTEEVTDLEQSCEYEFQRGNYWELARVGCHPNSPSRNAPAVKDFSGRPPLPTSYPQHTYKGYVVNWTANKDVCAQPHLRELHGSFIEPLSINTTYQLIPLFGGSKLHMNNEILIPPAMYWSKDDRYSGGEGRGPNWEEKQDRLIWRGTASGGRNHRDNWMRFQRHRFVSMVNGTTVKLVETVHESPQTFDLPSADMYDEITTRQGFLGDWLSDFSDAAFNDLFCFPEEGPQQCSYLSPYYTVKTIVHMKEQYKFKYLPDIDGNSFSGRYRGFLRSYSLPIKATIYNEWHDSRLVAWQHFVPMDNTYIDIYGIMDYFLGDHDTAASRSHSRYQFFAGRKGHDKQARTIAEEGSAWAERVLRREDMQIYIYRLLLEFARLCDERREYLGYVDDLRAHQSEVVA